MKQPNEFLRGQQIKGSNLSSGDENLGVFNHLQVIQETITQKLQEITGF